MLVTIYPRPYPSSRLCSYFKLIKRGRHGEFLISKPETIPAASPVFPKLTRDWELIFCCALGRSTSNYECLGRNGGEFQTTSDESRHEESSSSDRYRGIRLQSLQVGQSISVGRAGSPCLSLVRLSILSCKTKMLNVILKVMPLIGVSPFSRLTFILFL